MLNYNYDVTISFPAETEKKKIKSVADLWGEADATLTPPTLTPSPTKGFLLWHYFMTSI